MYIFILLNLYSHSLHQHTRQTVLNIESEMFLSIKSAYEWFIFSEKCFYYKMYNKININHLAKPRNYFAHTYGLNS